MRNRPTTLPSDLIMSNNMSSLWHILVIALGFGMPATGYIIPEELADGVYTADAYTGDLQLLQLLNTSDMAQARGKAANTESKPLNARHIPLPVSKENCPVGRTMDMDDYLSTLSAFSQWCDRGGKIPKKRICYVIVGTAVWYGCSAGGEQPCDSLEVNDADSSLNRVCGLTRPGWVYMKYWKKEYGRDVAGASICAVLNGNAEERGELEGENLDGDRPWKGQA